MQLSQPEPGLRALVESALIGKPVRLVRIETITVHGGLTSPAPEVTIDELNNLAPADFFERLYLHRYGEAPPAEILTAFTELVNTPTEAGAQS